MLTVVNGQITPQERAERPKRTIKLIRQLLSGRRPIHKPVKFPQVHVGKPIPSYKPSPSYEPTPSYEPVTAYKPVASYKPPPDEPTPSIIPIPEIKYGGFKAIDSPYKKPVYKTVHKPAPVYKPVPKPAPEQCLNQSQNRP